MRLSRSSLLITLLAIYVAFSGYAYFSPQGTVLVINYTNRAIVLIFLLGLAFILTALEKSKISFTAVIVFLPYFYMAFVSMIRMDGFYLFSALSRWMAYFLVFVYFSSRDIKLEKLVLFVNTIGISFLVQTGADYYLDRGLSINSAVRIGGGTGSPIGFAFALSVVGLANLYFFRLLHLNRYIIASLTLGGIIILTSTRSIFVAYFGIWGIYYILTSKSPSRLVINSAITAAVIGGLFYYIITFTDLGGRILLQGSEDSSAMFRFYLLEVVWREFDYLIFGTGLGGFPSWFYGKTFIDGVAPHFEFVFIFVEGGIVGSIIYLMSIIYLAVYSLRLDLSFRCYNTVLISIILIFSQQLAFQLANPTYFYQGMVPLVAILGFSLARRSKPIFFPSSAK